MEVVLDDIIGSIARFLHGGPGGLVVLVPIGVFAAVRSWQALQRRQAFRDFAAARNLQFVGIIPSDARAPYTRIELVRWAALLTNVVEGQWEGLPIYLFDMPKRRNLRWTTVLVTVEGRLDRGAAAERAIAAGPSPALIETNLDVLCVSPKRRLDPSELPAWLSFATALAKAMERDAKDAARFHTPVEMPSPPRTMFGIFNEE